MRLLSRLLLLTLLLAGMLVGGAWWWLGQPLVLPATTTAEQPLAVEIPPGASARGVASALTGAGVQAPPLLLQAWFRLSGQSRAIKAGIYEIQPGATPRSLLRQLVRGEQALRSLTLLEGWNFRELMAAVRASPDLTQDLEGLDGAGIMAKIGYPGRHPEGRFFPDTYRMVRQAPASSVLKQAAQAMEQRLAQAWEQRDPATLLRSPDEALILASIIEKETGAEADRAMVGGVFNNRLRIGMRLQTDPTVIYGLGERFDGNLRKIDLQTDTPYNSYTRAGLPPTPISMPGWASLLAAVKPADTRALYFVARGDGSSQFSTNLDEHNAAVRKFQLQK
ncbi:endolytic transglycosylase MltG [Hydrogenophaga pseudoflava]|uniref:endolytic transglycosylase MltG n=1 Tax=Hydrogenophaga pseudoflava TaxID=47421 RepID=UPI0026EB13F5|nr:endolytic transglycosylase MltG [Hydrogenophaga pseudoflava]